MKNKEKRKSFGKKFRCSILCAVIAFGSMLLFPQFEMRVEAKNHSCDYRWRTLSEGTAYQDLYEISSCEICGHIRKINYRRSEEFVRERFENQIKGARKDWVVVSELGVYHTVDDNLFLWLTERNDLTVMVTYDYLGTYYQTIFPAGADYTELLQDGVMYYGMPGLNGCCGIISSAGGKTPGDFPELVKLEGAEEFYCHIKMAPEQETVYANYGDVHTINEKLLATLSERRDVTAKVIYEYKGMNYMTTFPAEADYSELLKDGVQYYGMLGLSGRCGILTEIVY